MLASGRAGVGAAPPPARRPQALTCAPADAPGRKPAGRGGAVEHAHVVRRQELHELGILEGVALTAEEGGHLVRDVQDFPGDQGHGRSKHVLERKHTAQVRMQREPDGRGQARRAAGKGTWRVGGAPCARLSPAEQPPFALAHIGVQTGLNLKKHVRVPLLEEPGRGDPVGAVRLVFLGAEALLSGPGRAVRGRRCGPRGPSAPGRLWGPWGKESGRSGRPALQASFARPALCHRGLGTRGLGRLAPSPQVSKGPPPVWAP